MPHVVIEGPVSVGAFFQEFRPVYEQEAETIVKVKDIFINSSKTRALLESIVVEDRASTVFYIALSQGDNRVTVRLDALTDPEKSPGVKHLLALIGAQVKAQHADCRYGATNLESYLIHE